jgi:hypothetical protein
MRLFAEQSIIIPEGQYRGQRFRVHRQPFAGLLLDEMGSGRWQKMAITGCVQSGKTFTSLVIPLLYHLFEVREDVIVGVPKMEMAFDKWRKEFLPTILASPDFAKQLPDAGQGSKGGKFDSMRFKNGTWLKFMTGGGGDEMRSGYTTRVVVITEVDKMDEANEQSRETDPISQIEARTESYGDRAVSYKECTVSIEQGRIWQDYRNGSAARIVCQCPDCKAWITPEREHFLGISQAANAVQAGRLGYFACPACGVRITDDARRRMNQEARLIHRGQAIDDDGHIVGELPETDTLGFRWSAFNNLFWSSSHIAKQEWLSQHREDKEAGEREARQFRWVIPIAEFDGDAINVQVEDVVRRTVDNFPRGFVPTDSRWITIGVDVGKRECHWVAITWRRNHTGHVIDYGRFKVAADELGFRQAFADALVRFHASLGKIWTVDRYTRAFVDSRWSTNDVYAAIDLLNDRRWSPTVGMGAGHWRFKRYAHPQKLVANRITLIGEGYHGKINEKHREVYNIDANHWKTRLQESLVLPYSSETGQVTKGSVTLFAANADEHLEFAKHMASERQVVKFVPGEGMTQVWECPSGNNHWLDAVYLAMVAGARCGFRFADDDPPPAIEPQRPEPAVITTPDGREYLATERV